MSAAAVTDEVVLGFAEEVGPDEPVAVAGARTRWDVGGPLDDAARVVSAPTGIVEYQPGEMTVRVRAGTSVAELHAQLGAAGQRTALPERGGTVGGALAVGEDDLCVLGVGRVRTALLQARYVTAQGRIATGGGPTVKNVSGYDLPRLLVGSLGTLGLLGEVLLRTNPLPATSTWLVADDADPFVVVDRLYAPSAVLWDGTRTWVLLEGHGGDVAAERTVLADHGSFDEVDGPPDVPAHRWAGRRRDLHDPVAAWRGGTWVASVGTGTVFADRPQPRAEPEPALAALAARVKSSFDPGGRLSPGRDPAHR